MEKCEIKERGNNKKWKRNKKRSFAKFVAVKRALNTKVLSQTRVKTAYHYENATKKTVATIAPKAVILIMAIKTVFWYNLPKDTKIFNTSQINGLKHTIKRGIMEKLMSTKNLECHKLEKDNGEWQYLIFEKNAKTPIMALGKDAKLQHLANTMPLLIEDYKYYNQVCEIVSQIMIMLGGAK